MCTSVVAPASWIKGYVNKKYDGIAYGKQSPWGIAFLQEEEPNAVVMTGLLGVKRQMMTGLKPHRDAGQSKWQQRVNEEPESPASSPCR